MAKRKQTSKGKGKVRQSVFHRFWRKRRGLIIPGGLVIAAVAALLVFANPFATPTALDASGERVKTGPIHAAGAQPRVGRPAPNFALADYEGNVVRLDQFAGKVVLLNFWATWCTACEAEMPDMQRLAKKYGDDIVVLAVNRGESPSRAKKWSDARDLDSLVFVVDPRESVAGAYKLPNGMPQSFFIDQQGNITRLVSGLQSLAMMERNYKEALDRPQ